MDNYNLNSKKIDENLKGMQDSINKIENILFEIKYFPQSKIIKTKNKKKKGSLCSENGNNYEKKIYNVVKNCFLNGIKFNTQEIKELAGSSSSNDICCNLQKKNDIGIEAKINNTPDWMQCSIKYNSKQFKWEGSENGKIPEECKNIFNKLINNINLFNGEIPPFINEKMTYQEWLDIKKNNNKWKDIYIDIPNDIIKNLYNLKGCQYIQISDFGLYHTGNDICDFKVPEFIIEQQMRIRIKVHSKKNKKGFCNLSITASCQPKNIKHLKKSNYSLDNVNNLPNNIIYNSIQ